jgi:hypothetical protein
VWGRNKTGLSGRGAGIGGPPALGYVCRDAGPTSTSNQPKEAVRRHFPAAGERPLTGHLLMAVIRCPVCGAVKLEDGVDPDLPDSLRD